MACSGAVAVRIAQAQGAGRLDTLRPVARAATGLALACTAGVGALMWWGDPAIGAAIVDDPAVVLAATAIFAPMQLADALQSVMLGTLRGLSDTTFPAAVPMIAH